MAVETRYCAHCGSQLSTGSDRCAVCGALAPVASADPAPLGAAHDEPAQRNAPDGTATGSAGASPFVVAAQAAPPDSPALAPPHSAQQPAQQPSHASYTYPGYSYGASPAAATTPAASSYSSSGAPNGYGAQVAPAANAQQYGQQYAGWPGAWSASPYASYFSYAPYTAYSPYTASTPYMPYTAYAPVFYRAPRPASETYALVISWIVTVMGGLSILLSLLWGLVAVLFAALGFLNNLLFEGLLLVPGLCGVIGGAFAIYFGVTGILRRPSPRFKLPNPLFFLGLTALVIVGAILLWHLYLSTGPGATIAIFPLMVLSGVLPALTILAFASWRLGMPSTRRHVLMSLFYGMTLAPLLAIIFEVINELLINRFTGRSVSLNPNDPSNFIPLLLDVAVSAPLVEEAVKPLGAILLIPRLRTPASAFLVGLAGGIGFNILETTYGYIGQGEVDWINVAIVRLGAGLLHGLGAGMTALAWYYLINGKGIPLRWLRAAGCIAYAVLQHAIFNGSTVLVGLLPEPVLKSLSEPVYFGQLALGRLDLLFMLLDVIILVVLILMTGGLRHARIGQRNAPPPDPAPASPAPGVALNAASAGSAASTPVGSAAR